jgi:hypothetical protein
MIFAPPVISSVQYNLRNLENFGTVFLDSLSSKNAMILRLNTANYRVSSVLLLQAVQNGASFVCVHGSLLSRILHRRDAVASSFAVQKNILGQR